MDVKLTQELDENPQSEPSITDIIEINRVRWQRREYTEGNRGQAEGGEQPNKGGRERKEQAAARDDFTPCDTPPRIVYRPCPVRS